MVSVALRELATGFLAILQIILTKKEEERIKFLTKTAGWQQTISPPCAIKQKLFAQAHFPIILFGCMCVDADPLCRGSLLFSPLDVLGASAPCETCLCVINPEFTWHIEQSGRNS